jgi:hypothetical protein
LRCFRVGGVSVSAGDGIPFDVVRRELALDPPLRFDLDVSFLEEPG